MTRTSITAASTGPAAATLRFPYRQVSPRAVAVHQPREACGAAGFSPRF